MWARLYDMKEIIFGVGLPRTGTRSLAKAMSMLGYRTGHYFDRAQFLGTVLRKDPQVDFACDLPIPLFMNELAEVFPCARFVYTARSLDVWGPSMRRLIARNGWTESSDWHHWRQQLFGADDALPHLLRTYKAHEAKVALLARDRDVLRLDIGAGDGFDILCDWLGLPAPVLRKGDGAVLLAPFPHEGASNVQA